MRTLFQCLFAGFYFISLANSNAVAQQAASASQASWQRLITSTVKTAEADHGIRLPEGVPRVLAIRLLSKDRDVTISQLVIHYATGQADFHVQPIKLTPGAPSKAIGNRKRATVAHEINLVLPAVGSETDLAQVEVWGLVPPRSESVSKPAGKDISLNFRNKRRGQTAAKMQKDQKRYVEVPVFYGTTRKREADRVKNKRKLALFSGEQGSQLTLGRSIVTVPIERKVGTIPRPGTDLIFAKISFRDEDPNRDFTIAAVDVMPRSLFLSEIAKQVSLSSRYSGQALLFVHGYNVGFDDAIFRTAQIAHDMNFDGPAVTFSWPSRGGMLDYRHDIDTAKAARGGLRNLLQLLAGQESIRGVNIIAHSMGSDPLLEVLSQQSEIARSEGRIRALKLNEIVFAAPDVSRSVFGQMTRRLGALVKGGITLYASQNDTALRASRRLASGIQRAGGIPAQGILIVPGVESIDVSAASTSFFSFNHTSFAERQHLITDMGLLFERSTNKHPPHVRFPIYRPANSGGGTWWRYSRN